ncbi:hypothetical protein DICVIV_00271 [Dictyocaulus viviparus]|uniref:Uncharacterized protein n=1 Tax=Dictyocaulus viviparus TaxID=29172 RepID=A0A0D8YFU8_DICVI|nr:hypothetical protein DICVIV_00271 [Dictyocaulus viviparus]
MTITLCHSIASLYSRRSDSDVWKKYCNVYDEGGDELYRHIKNYASYTYLTQSFLNLYFDEYHVHFVTELLVRPSVMQRYTSRVFGNKTNFIGDRSEQDGNFSATSFTMKAQKKIASKLSTRKVTKLFLSDDIDRIFESLYSVLRTYYSKNDAEKVVKNVIKLSVKMALLARNDLLSQSDRKQLTVVQKQLHSLTLTIISFVQSGKLSREYLEKIRERKAQIRLNIKYSFERSHLIEKMRNIQQSLAPLIGGPHAEILSKFASTLEESLESEDL